MEILAFPQLASIRIGAQGELWRGIGQPLGFPGGFDTLFSVEIAGRVFHGA
jgi:hypothetical protein